MIFDMSEFVGVCKEIAKAYYADLAAAWRQGNRNCLFSGRSFKSFNPE